jgi:exosortase/archaeosortase family protein
MFLAYSVAAAFITWRHALDRSLLILSAIPIAQFANVSRIIAKGVIHETMGERASAVIYHGLTGWLMLVLALAVLYGECRLLKLVFVGPTYSTTNAPSPAVDVVVEVEKRQSGDSRSSLIAIGLAVPVIILSGIAYGHLTDRGRMSPALSPAFPRSNNFRRLSMIGKAERE